MAWISVSARSSPPRHQWVDVSRGLGIILVVYGHILHGHYVSDAPAWVNAQDVLIYSFHMPLFFMLSGLFLWSSVGKGDFLQSRWNQLIYPYLLWSLVTVALETALQRYVNSPLSFRDAVLIPFVPQEQYWFLYALLVCQMVVFVGYPRKWLLVPLALTGLLVLELVSGGWIVLRSFLYLPFVLLGVLGKNAFDYLSHSTPKNKILVAICAWLCFAALLTSRIEGTAFLLGALGSVGTAALAMLCDQQKFLGALGRASLAIYLLHTIFSAGSRILTVRLGLPASSIESVLIALIAGLAIPFMIWELARRFDFTRRLGLGVSS